MLSTTVYLPTTEAKPLDDETAISDYSKQGNRNKNYARNHYQYNALNQLTQVDNRDSSRACRQIAYRKRKARYYSPYLRSLLSRDTYDLANRYAYVKGNPINYTDPSGHADIPLGDWGESVAWRNEALLLKTSRMPKMKLPRPAENPITYLREALQVKRQDIPEYVYRIDGRTPQEINSNKHLGFRPKEYVNLNPDWKQGPGNPKVETLMRTMIGNRHADGSYHTGANGVSVSYNLNFSAAVPKYSGYLYRIKGKGLPENTFKIEQPADITLYNVGNYNFEMNFVGRARRSNIEYYSTSKNRWQPINNFISRDNPYMLVQRNERNVMTGVQMANLPYSKTNGIYLFQQWYRRIYPSITWTFY